MCWWLTRCRSWARSWTRLAATKARTCSQPWPARPRVTVFPREPALRACHSFGLRLAAVPCLRTFCCQFRWFTVAGRAVAALRCCCVAGGSRAAWSNCLACRCWPGRPGRRRDLFGGLHVVEHVQEDLLGDHAGAEFPGEAGFS